MDFSSGHREEEARVYQPPGQRQGVSAGRRRPGQPPEDSGDRLLQRPADLYEGRQQGLQSRRTRFLPVIRKARLLAGFFILV